jgi:hypothetical protein
MRFAVLAENKASTSHGTELDFTLQCNILPHQRHLDRDGRDDPKLLFMYYEMRHPESLGDPSVSCLLPPPRPELLFRPVMPDRARPFLRIFNRDWLTVTCVRGRRSPKKWTQVSDPRRSARIPRRLRCRRCLPVKVEFTF